MWYWLLLALSASALFHFSSNYSPAGLASAAVAVLLLFAIVFFWRKNFRTLLLSLTLLPLLCLSFFVHEKRLHSWRLPSHEVQQAAPVIGVVDGVVTSTRYGKKFRFRLQQWRENVLPRGQQPLVQLTCYHDACSMLANEQWRLQITLKPRHGNVNFSGFDYEKQLYSEHVIATGQVLASDVNLRLNIGEGLDAWRQQWQQKIDELGLMQPGLVSGISIGLDEAIPGQQWQDFRVTGTTHLVAISGLHIVLVAGLVGALTGFVWRRVPCLALRLATPKAASLAGAMLACVYAGMAGFSVPTVRALLLALSLSVALWRGQSRAGWQALFGVAIVILLADPCAVLMPGYWLSVAAVAILMHLGNGQFLSSSAGENRLGQTQLIGGMRVQVLLSLALVPLTLAFFDQASWLSPLVNAWAIPWVSFVATPLALIGVLLLPLQPDWAAVVLGFADTSLDCFVQGVALFAHIPGAEWLPPSLSPVELLLLFMGSGLLLLPSAFGLRLSALLLIAAILVSGQQAEHPPAAISVLDVGQGLAVVVESGDQVLVYDTGDAGDKWDHGRDTVAAYLRHRGQHDVDWLWLSHADRDHAGGFSGLHKSLSVRHIRSGEPVSGAFATPCRAGQQLVLGAIDITVLWPFSAGEGNSQSCVLRLRIKDYIVLLTGDIERRDEAAILHRYTPAELRADLLIAPHHGSATSSTAAFIAAVSPRTVVFSAGYRHRFGHPRADVVARYQHAGATILNTAETGALRWQWSSLTSSPAVEQARQADRRWRSSP